MKQKTNENIPLRVLYLEDSPQDIEIIRKLLIEAGYDIILDCAEMKDDIISLIRSNKYDIILSDFKLPGFDAFGALELCKDICPYVPFICVSGSIGEETAIEIIKKGAADYVLKDHMVRLPLTINRALEEAKEKKLRNLTEEALQESEERYEALFERSLDLVYICDFEGNFIDANDAALNLLGYKREEIRYLSFASLLSEDQLPLAFKSMQEIKESGIQKDLVEFRLRCRNGKEVYVESKGSAIISNGMTVAVQSIARDITERKRVEETLRDSKQMLQIILDSITSAVFWKNRDLMYLGGNRTWLDAVGLKSSEEVAGKSDYDLPWGKNQADLYREYDRRIIDSGVPEHDIIETYLRADGNQAWARTNKIPLRDTEGKVVGILGTYEDITERKRAEEKIAEQARMIEVAIDTIIVQDMEDRLLFWNKAAEKLYGWTFEEACSLNIRLMVVDEEKAKYEKSIQEFLHNGEWEGEFHQKTKDDRILLTHSRWTLVRDKDGKPTSRLIITRDVTEQRALEAQLRRAQRLENLGTLAGGIAHDLNNVLAPILMATQVIEKRTTDPQIKKIVGSMEKSVKRGRDIIKQILLFARGGEKGFAPQQVKYIIDEMKSIISETFPRNIELSVHIIDVLKIVMGDATQLHQVIMNLCLNARDAMPNGGQLKIYASNVFVENANAIVYDNVKRGNYVLLKVTDTGVGISKENQEKVFEPFFTTKELEKGTGLGLSIVFGIIKEHKGFIKLSSEIGKGTEFKIYLPAEADDKQLIEIEDVIDIPSSRGETIMIVDDEAAILQISREALESFGYKVITANNGSDAILTFSMSAKGLIKLVIIDSNMPVMDGTTTIGVLRQFDPSVKIILSSGTVTNTGDPKLATLDIQGNLVKPYTAKKMLKTVWSVLHT